MKELTNYTLLLYEQTFGRIKVDLIKSNIIKLFIAVFSLPFLFVFIIIALLIEEPIKCLLALIFMQTTPKKVWIYYKKCWDALLRGMQSH